MSEQLTGVSLFAGIGGFDIAMQNNGVKVVAACEIDKNASRVLKHRFPETTLFQDVKELTGDQLITAGFIPERGIIAGGFPCQDLSVAGKRLGFTGARSSLFYQVARIADETKARWLVLENVFGLLSSQRGADMGAVVGTLVDLGYCVAWRVLDAQYFGVPQRRRRVFIVAERAGDPVGPAQVLFERQSVRGDFAPSGEAWQEVARTTGEGTSGSSQSGRLIGPLTATGMSRARGTETVESGHYVLETAVFPINTFSMGGRPDPANDARMTMGVGGDGEPQFTLSAHHSHAVAISPPEEAVLYEPHHGDGREAIGVANTLNARMGTGGNNTPVLIDPIAYSVREDAKAGNFSATELDTANTIQSYLPTPQSHHAQMFIVGETVEPRPIQDSATQFSGKRGDKNDGRGNGLGIGGEGDPMYTLTSSDRHAVFTSEDVAYGLEPGAAQRLNERHWEEMSPTLRANAGDNQASVATSLAVRRLTPLECERLQGFPDGWTLDIGDGKTQPDSHRYKQLGNAVAVPVVDWVLKGIVGVTLSGDSNSVG